MSLSFSYPAWFLILCVLLGILYAGILYYKDRSYADVQGSQRWFLPLMTFLRWAGATLIAALLLAPFLKTIHTEEQRPYIIIAQDRSQSIARALKGEDSTSLRAGLEQLTTALSEKYKVETYSFDDQLNEKFDFSFPGKATDLSAVTSELYNRYNNQNIGAVIMATDGIYNQGSNPLYMSEQLNVPIYAIALGDTTPYKDIKVEKVLHNNIVYLGDKFTIRADMSGYNSSGAHTVLSVNKGKGNSNKLYSNEISINKNNFVQSEDIIIETTAVGVQAYTISLSAIEGELTTQNNSKTIYVEVLEGRQNVLILAASPSPDIAALRKAIDRGKNYVTEEKLASEFNGSIAAYDMIILHGLPTAAQNCESILTQAEKNNISILYIITSQTSINLLNTHQDLLKINNPGNAFNDVKPLMPTDFSLFSISDGLREAMTYMPPLKSRFAEYANGNNGEVLLAQKIGQVSTNFPLLSFRKTPTHKIAIIAGEGIWLWRMYDYMKFGTFDHIDELLEKTVQYLSIKEDRRKFRATTPQSIYRENEKVSFDAELYNDSYELINEPDARLLIKDAQGKEYPYVFSRTSNAYELNTGILPVNEYSFTAKTNYGGKELTSSGQFTVRELQLETTQTTADHNLLLNLAKKSGGELLSPDDIANIENKINARTDIKPVLYSSTENNAVINLKWIFFFLLALLCIEWFLRKFLGGL